MTFCRLGTSNIQVSPLTFGGNVFGWTVDEATAFSLLDALTDTGINFIDTAGKWLKRSGKRADVVIATKVGQLKGRQGLSRDNILKAADDSLRRLQTTFISRIAI